MLRRDLCCAVTVAWAGAWPETVRAATVDETWRDARRARDVPVRLRWPAGESACAVVLLSHGLGGSREGGSLWAEAWRAAGFLVVSLQHPGSDTGVLRQGLQALGQAASAQQLAQRVADVRHALDEIERRSRSGPAAWTRVAGQAVGLAGHSFGARTVLALAGQRFGVAGAEDWPEPRLRAFVALSPALGSSAGMTPQAQLRDVLAPVFCVTGSLDQNPLGAERTGEHRLVVYEGLPAALRALLWLEGADHMSFAGNPETGSAPRSGPFARAEEAVRQASRHQALVAGGTAAWWAQALLGQPRAMAQWHAAARGAGLAGLAAGDRFLQD